MKLSMAHISLAAILVGLCGCGMLDDGKTGAVGEEICAAKSTRNAIQEALFDGAVAKFDGEPLEINNMRRNARSQLEFVVLDGTDEDIGRTNCSARLNVTIPVDMQDKFGGDDELQADISYFAQNAADGSGRVVEVDGLDSAIGKITDAFSAEAPKQAPRPVQTAEPPPPKQASVKTFNPSFRCDGKLRRVEKMICADPVLAQLDREMAMQYYRALEAPYNKANRAAIKSN